MDVAGFTTQSGSGYKYQKCTHYGDRPEFYLFDRQLSIAGAAGHDVGLPLPGDLRLIIDLDRLVDLSPPKYEPFVKTGPTDLIDLLQTVAPPPPPPPPPILRLDWGDRCAPRVPIEWWTTLLNKLVADYSGHIIVACVGGHGRTGTALSSMILAANPGASVEEAVKFVRDVHCSKSVESVAQFEYLARFRPGERETNAWLKRECSYSVSAGYTNVTKGPALPEKK